MEILATRSWTNFFENKSLKWVDHDFNDFDEKSRGLRSSDRREQILPCSGLMRDHGNSGYGATYYTGLWRRVWVNASASALRAASSLLSDR